MSDADDGSRIATAQATQLQNASREIHEALSHGLTHTNIISARGRLFSETINALARRGYVCGTYRHGTTDVVYMDAVAAKRDVDFVAYTPYVIYVVVKMTATGDFEHVYGPFSSERSAELFVRLSRRDDERQHEWSEYNVAPIAL
jgi:hypothetical protein